MSQWVSKTELFFDQGLHNSFSSEYHTRPRFIHARQVEDANFQSFLFIIKFIDHNNLTRIDETIFTLTIIYNQFKGRLISVPKSYVSPSRTPKHPITRRTIKWDDQKSDISISRHRQTRFHTIDNKIKMTCSTKLFRDDTDFIPSMQNHLIGRRSVSDHAEFFTFALIMVTTTLGPSLWFLLG